MGSKQSTEKIVKEILITLQQFAYEMREYRREIDDIDKQVKDLKTSHDKHLNETLPYKCIKTF